MLKGSEELISVYFGGGTPSLLAVSHFEKILSWVKKRFSKDFENNLEITAEINPKDVSSKEKINDLFSLGINRLSLGVQTFDDALLQLLERNSSTSREIIQALDLLSQSKIQNLSIDLLFDIPKQTFSSFEKSLQKIIKWPKIKHLSLYNLVFEPHTPFHVRKPSLQPFLPSEEESFRMLKEATSWLKSHGFIRYEISAFGKKGFFSKHNLGYWTGRPFLGLGPSAFSYLDHKRFQNVSHLENYVQKLSQNLSPISFEEKLTFPENFKERLLIGLRQSDGVDLKSLEEEFLNQAPESLLQNLTMLENENFLSIARGKVLLTEKGKNFYDTVAEKLL